MRRNIDQTFKTIEQHPATEQVHLDGDSEEAIIRCIIGDYDIPADLESTIESLPNVSISRSKWLGFAREVILR